MWKVSFLNSLNGETLNEKTFRTIEEIHKEYQHIPLSTWRNISIGRSKIYDKFLKLEKSNLKEKVKEEKIIQEIEKKVEENVLEKMKNTTPLNIVK